MVFIEVFIHILLNICDHIITGVLKLLFYTSAKFLFSVPPTIALLASEDFVLLGYVHVFSLGPRHIGS